MKIAVIGGGPAGMYFSILVKKALPQADISIYEQNNLTDSFGFGVVFSGETLNEFLTKDARSYELIKSEFAYWDNLDVYMDGEIVRIQGNGFCGCSRKTLLSLLAQRCEEEGVKTFPKTRITDLDQFADCDMIVAADGINSWVRQQFEEDFGTEVIPQRNRFVWMGSTKPLDAFTYFFKNTEFGPFVAHAYQYEEGMSTWVIETTDETYERAGFVMDDEEGTRAKLEAIFAEELDGHPLLTNRSHWRNFPLVTNKKWHKDNVILLGDSVASAHFSIGSGTKLAMQEAIFLAESVIAYQRDVSKVFEHYEQSFRSRVESIQHAANVSMAWFEDMELHMKQPDFMAFAFDVMSRSRKVTYENQSIRDPNFTKQVVAAFNAQLDQESNSSPAFTPFTLRSMTLKNRLVMSAMGQYSAVDGLVGDWHLMHYGSRASGGLGLLIAEMTAVEEVGRISQGCAGIYNDAQQQAWKRIVDFVHQHTAAKIALQIGHSGPKGSVNRLWDGGFEPLDDGNGWPLISASNQAYADGWNTPAAMGEEDIERVISAFVSAAKRADEAGFDMVEISACHGMLLASFLSPLTNKRTDSYGGSIANRLRFPTEVVRRVREVFSADKPISVKISAVDWHPEGNMIEEGALIAEAFKEAGADMISVSSGGTTVDQRVKPGPMWQVPLANAIKKKLNIPTMAMGDISTIDNINTVLLAGRADLIAVGKSLLTNPGLALQAAAYEGQSRDGLVPEPYLVGVDTLYNYQQRMRRDYERMKIALKPKGHM